MKKVKRISVPVLICALLLILFTGCHSHSMDSWKIDKDSHRKECSCGETAEIGEHTFDTDVCTVCGAERSYEDGVLTGMGVWNDYGDWTQWLYFDEAGNVISDSAADYTYDKAGNKLTDKIYEDGVLVSSAEYDFDSDGMTFKKYETEYYEDGSKCVYEYNESGDSMGYEVYDENGTKTESYRSEYITDEKGELVGEKVYENDVLIQEMKYAAGNDGTEEFLYITEMASYDEDGARTVEIYDENGEVIKELGYDAEGTKLYDYELKYIYDAAANLVAIEKVENGEVKQEIKYEYNSDGALISEKTYEGEKLLKEAEYTTTDEFTYESKVIIYNEDGTTTVQEYDEYGELIG